MMEIILAEETSHIKVIEKLAYNIWNQHYIPIIGKTQVDYMVSKFQSAKAIMEQIEEGYQYFLVQYNSKPAGYFAILADRSNNTMFLSKLYVDNVYRRNGIGRACISYIEDICKKFDLNSIWLTVNKDNIDSIMAYEKMGFKKIDKIVTDIGDGFVMDDYKMEKLL